MIGKEVIVAISRSSFGPSDVLSRAVASVFQIAGPRLKRVSSVDSVFEAWKAAAIRAYERGALVSRSATAEVGGSAASRLGSACKSEGIGSGRQVEVMGAKMPKSLFRTDALPKSTKVTGLRVSSVGVLPAGLGMSNTTGLCKYTGLHKLNGNSVMHTFNTARSFHSGGGSKRKFTSFTEAAAAIRLARDYGNQLTVFLGRVVTRMSPLENFSLYVNFILLALVKAMYDKMVADKERIDQIAAANEENLVHTKKENEREMELLKAKNERDMYFMKAAVADEIARLAAFHALTAESLIKHLSNGPDNKYEEAAHTLVGQLIVENHALRAALSKLTLASKEDGKEGGDQCKNSGTK